MKVSSLHVFESEYDWIVAGSKEDADKAWESFTGEKLDVHDNWQKLPDNLELSIWAEIYKGRIDDPIIRRLRQPKYSYVKQIRGHILVHATCADWAQACGLGMLGSTEW